LLLCYTGIRQQIYISGTQAYASQCCQQISMKIPVSPLAASKLFDLFQTQCH